MWDRDALFVSTIHSYLHFMSGTCFGSSLTMSNSLLSIDQLMVHLGSSHSLSSLAHKPPTECLNVEWMAQ